MSYAQWPRTAMLVLVWGAIGIDVNLRAQDPAPGVGPRPGAIGKSSTSKDVPVHLVKPGKLSVTVPAKGTVETSRFEFATCLVEGKRRPSSGSCPTGRW